jgi:uncharacterized protein YndB with AHSA1/START domain
MVRIEANIDIDAPPARVWRALCDPAEVALWDSAVEVAIDAPADYPKPGQVVHWRLRAGPFRALPDRPQVVEPERALRSLLSFGPFQLDETYTITSVPGGCRLAVFIDAEARVPVFATLIERTYLGPAVRRDFDASLAGIKQHCEATP